MKKIESYDDAFRMKLTKMSKEDRAKAGLKKLVADLDLEGESEPEGLASGESDVNGDMLMDMDEDFDDDK